jgi:hypothetical protein
LTGDFHIVQQFNTYSLNPGEAAFTPDSQYAIISFCVTSIGPDMVIYRIGGDSRLTEIDDATYPEATFGITMTHDGKFGVTRALVNNITIFYVMRIHEDGTLEYLPDKDYVTTGHDFDLAFVPPQKTEADSSWTMYH